MRTDFLKFALTYAVRSLARSPRRTVLLVATVVLSVSVSIVAKAYADEIFRFWIASATESGTGDAQIHKTGFWDDAHSLSRDYCFSEGNELESFLLNDPDVAGIAPRLNVEGLVSSGNRSIYFSGLGLIAGREAVVSPQLFSFHGNRGSFVQTEELAGVALGKGLAESLNVDIGDAVTLTVQTVDNRLNALDAVVRGIVNFPDAKLSKRLVYMNLAYAQNLLQLNGYVSELTVALKKGKDLEAWTRKRTTDVHAMGAQLRPWWEVFPPIKKVQTIWQSVVGLICMLLFLSTSLSVLNVIFLTVNERTVEIGILMALGAKARDVKRLFAIEAAVMGVIGALVGVGVGLVVTLVMRMIGVPLINPFFDGYIYVYPRVQPLTSFIVAVAAVVIAYVSSLMPSSRASKVDPVIAFRGQV